MSLRAVEHSFSGATVAISAYDSTKTSLGSLMVQKSGPNPEDNFAGPMPVSVVRPLEESTATNMMYPHVLTYSSTIDWVFLIENSAAAAKKIYLYEYNKTSSTYNWKGFITVTTPQATNVARGFRALRYLHTTGTVAVGAPVSVLATGTVTVTAAGVVTHSGTSFLVTHVGMMIGFGSATVTAINSWLPIVSFTSTSIIGVAGSSVAYAAGTSFVIASCTVTGTNTQFVNERIACGTTITGSAGGLGPRIGFGSTDPLLITQWFQIGFITSGTSLNLVSSPGVIAAGTSYVIEELRFVMTLTNGTTASNGGLFLAKGIGYMDFNTAGGVILPAMTSVILDNQRGVYWLADAGTVTNTAAAGCAVEAEISKVCHYCYVLDGSSTSAKIFKYNLRATGTPAAGKITLSATDYSTGTVTVTGTAVAGSGTTFTFAMQGRQIGFGSTNPVSITTWYTILTFTDASNLVLSSSAGSLGSGLSYVIRLADVVVTGTQSSLTGNVSNANVGTVATNNGVIATTGTGNGPIAGVPALYFVTTTRLYCAALSGIGSGSTTFINTAHARQEIPPGGAAAFPATGNLMNINYNDAIDRFVITTYGSGAAYRNYVTRYPQYDGIPFDHVWSIDDKQQDQMALAPQAAVHFNSGSQLLAVDCNNGVVHVCRQGTTAALNQMYPLPFAAHWTYAYTTTPANHQRIITPSISTPGCVKFDQVWVIDDKFFGSGELRLQPDAYRVYYRTTNIAVDSTSSWTLLGYDGDLSGVAAASAIQFMFEFFTIGLTCLPARLIKLMVTYEDGSTDSHYELSAYSDSTAKSFIWRMKLPFGGTVPALKFQLYNTDTVSSESLIQTDYTDAPTLGVWSKATDGGGTGATWNSYDSGDKANETTYIRYVPTSLADNIKVRALLTQK